MRAEKDRKTVEKVISGGLGGQRSWIHTDSGGWGDRKMGRRKREIKPIKDKNSRQVTFSKRRKGLIKKAKELSVLCDVDVALVIFSNRGTLYDFSSTSSLTEMAQRYRSHMEVEKENPEGISGTEHSKYASFTTVGELLQTVERQLDKADDDDDTSLNDLVHLENQLQTALMQARSRKTDLMIESVKSLHEKEKQLREENKLLEDMINMKKKNKEVMNGMPLSFTNLAPIPMNREQQRPTLNFL